MFNKNDTNDTSILLLSILSYILLNGKSPICTRNHTSFFHFMLLWLSHGNFIYYTLNIEIDYDKLGTTNMEFVVGDKMIKLKYGNTNTFFISGNSGNILIDTDYAGTLPAFYKALKVNNIRVSDITYILATHYHPDHMGLVSELMRQGVKLLLLDTQIRYVHYADDIFCRDKYLKYEPINEADAITISCAESRDFLYRIGIFGEIISTPSHSADSISVVLDNGDCIVGDLEPIEYLRAYEKNEKLEEDWQLIMGYKPKIVYYAHANEKIIV